MLTKLRVRRGYKLLNKFAPNELSKVDPNQINMRDVNSCVLGLVFGHYSKGVHILDLIWGEPLKYGFVADQLSKDAYPKLNKEWKRVLAKAS